MRPSVQQRAGEKGRTDARQEGYRLPALHPRDLSSVLSMGLDLAEGKAAGHAQRVCYIGVRLAQAAGLAADEEAAVYYACLLHDLGVPEACGLLPPLPPKLEDQVFARLPLAVEEELVKDLTPETAGLLLTAVRLHVQAGAEAAGTLALPPGVQEGIRYHHERWDGRGFPEGLAEDRIPAVARVVAAADTLEAVIAAEGNPLAARAVAVDEARYLAGRALDPDLAEIFADLARGDEFWLGLFDDRLPALLPEMVQDTLRASRKALVRFAETMADVVDARNTFTRGHSRRTADLARRIAGWLGLDEGHTDLVRLAALWHNLGSLGVPKRIIAKPDILTLEERDLLYQHPVTGREIVSRLPGLEPVAAWIAAHHERPDGKGYPEMLEGDQVPLESRIVAAADVYEALTADRPYRPAMPRDQALLVVEGLAGAQLDPVVVEALKAVV